MPRHRHPALAQLHAYLPTALAAYRFAARASGWCYPTRWRCLLVGHDDQLGREPRRLFLRCAACGRCTRGWAIGVNPPHVTVTVERRRTPTAADPLPALVRAR